MTELEQILDEVLDKWGRETVQAILRKMDSYPIRWQGTLRRSVSFIQKDQQVEFLMADYGKFIDEGIGIFGPRKTRIPLAKKGALAYHLKTWASTKNLNSWAVATNIIKRGGIKPRPFFDSVIQSRTPQLETAIDTAYQKYMTDMVNKVASGK